MSVTQLTATVTQTAATVTPSTLAAGGNQNDTVINPNTLLEVQIAAGTINNPIIVAGAGPDNLSGAIIMTVAGNATLAGNIQMTNNTTVGVDVGGTLTFTGVVSDTGASGYNLTKMAGGALISIPNPRRFTRPPRPGGAVTATSMVVGGTGYITPPLVTVSGGGSPTTPAVITANIVDGVVTSLNIVNAGAGYTSAPTLTISPPTGSTTNGGNTYRGMTEIDNGNVAIGQPFALGANGRHLRQRQWPHQRPIGAGLYRQSRYPRGGPRLC